MSSTIKNFKKLSNINISLINISLIKQKGLNFVTFLIILIKIPRKNITLTNISLIKALYIKTFFSTSRVQCHLKDFRCAGCSQKPDIYIRLF